jgi:hypothetical protein
MVSGVDSAWVACGSFVSVVVQAEIRTIIRARLTISFFIMEIPFLG